MAVGDNRQLQICDNNPSVSFADSSLYTREPWMHSRRCNRKRGQPLSLGCAEPAPLEGEPIYFPAVVPRRGFLVAGESAEPGWYHLF